MARRMAFWSCAMAMMAATVSPANAENWIEVAHNDLGNMCVDKDTIRTDGDGDKVVYFRNDLFCLEPSVGVIFEIKVRCDQDFSREMIVLTEKVYSSRGNLKPDKPWTDKEIYVSSLEGQAARQVCGK